MTPEELGQALEAARDNAKLKGPATVAVLALLDTDTPAVIVAIYILFKILISYIEDNYIVLDIFTSVL